MDFAQERTFGPPPDPNSGLEPMGVPVARFGRILRRHAWLILFCCLLGTVGSALLVSRMPKQYTAEATLLIEPNRTQVSDLQAISADSEDMSSLIRTQIDILSAPALAIGVVKSLHLAHDPEFLPVRGGIKARLLHLLRRLSHAATQPDPTDPVEAAGIKLSSMISFANETHSDVLHILVTTRRAALSADIANAMVEQYLDFKRQEKFVAMQRARDWFQQQLGTLGEQVHADEIAVEQYRQQHGLRETLSSVTGDPTSQSSTRQELDAVTGLLAQASRDRAEKEAQLAQARAALRGDVPLASLPELVNSPIVSALVEQISVVAGREAQLSATEGAGNPELAAVRSQLAKLQHRAEREMNIVALSLTSAVNAARGQERDLEDQLDQLRGSVSDENSAQIGLQSLETKTRATRSIYESFLNRATELANTAGIQDPDASLVSGARPPLGPSAPKSTRLVAIALVLSTALGVGLACLRERLRRGFSMPEQLEAYLRLGLLATVPSERRRSLLQDRGSPVGRAAFDKLRGRIRSLGAERPKVVMVTSAVPGEGKSVFAAGWARNASEAGWKVLLIECDFCRPSLPVLLGCLPSPGLGEILSGKLIGPDASTLRQVSPNLDFIPAGMTIDDPQELLASARMAGLVDSARTKYDLVILDTPPVLPVADALVLARLVDTTVLAVRWERTAREEVADAMKLLRGSGARILGAVMTRADRRMTARSSGIARYGYRGYGSPGARLATRG